MNKDSDSRDMLALERTRLINERSLLAYIRAGLSLLAAAARAVKFLPHWIRFAQLPACWQNSPKPGKPTRADTVSVW
jgi:uncharacterized membrane protein YidH (DUF202 family)